MISVCLATYNGEKYIREQLNSILAQLSLEDELLIVDDCSNDATCSIVRGYVDPRIRLFHNSSNKGVNFTFNRAINLCKGDYIFLSDQDDIWEEGHLRELLDILVAEKVSLVSANFKMINGFGNPIGKMKYPLKYNDSKRYFINVWKIFLGKIDYYGCCMAFRCDFKELILPFPRFIESHDLWIAMCANIIQSNSHHEQICLQRRIHGANVSVVERRVFIKVFSRCLLFLSLMMIYVRLLRKSKFCRFKVGLD